MDFPIRRVALGAAAVAVVAGLCFVAVWSVRGRLAPAAVTHVQETAISPSAANDAATIAVLKAQVARLQSERDAALARVRSLEAGALPVAAEPAPPGAVRQAPPAPAATGAFGEPQTFGTLSTSQ